MSDYVFEEHVRPLILAINRLTEATEKKKTIVPLMIFVPQQVTADQIHQIAEMIRHELRVAGLMPPEETDA